MDTEIAAANFLLLARGAPNNPASRTRLRLSPPATWTRSSITRAGRGFRRVPDSEIPLAVVQHPGRAYKECSRAFTATLRPWRPAAAPGAENAASEGVASFVPFRRRNSRKTVRKREPLQEPLFGVTLLFRSGIGARPDHDLCRTDVDYGVSHAVRRRAQRRWRK